MMKIDFENSRKKGPFELMAERWIEMFRRLRELTVKHGIILLFLEEIENDPD